jgi:hypothetical protein
VPGQNVSCWTDPAKVGARFFDHKPDHIAEAAIQMSIFSVASILVLAFERDAKGELVPAFNPTPMPDDLHAKVIALDLRGRYAGVVAWRRCSDAAPGGETEILAIYGDVPATMLSNELADTNSSVKHGRAWTPNFEAART